MKRKNKDINEELKEMFRKEDIDHLEFLKKQLKDLEKKDPNETSLVWISYDENGKFKSKIIYKTVIEEIEEIKKQIDYYEKLIKEDIEF